MAFHPELRRAARWIPRISFGPKLVWLVNAMLRRRGISPPPEAEGVVIRDVVVPGPPDNPQVRVRVYSPAHPADAGPALLWVHGGGFIIGTPEQDQANLIALCRELGLVIAAPAYRLAPQHPHPAPVEDAYAALTWLHSNAAKLGVSPQRIAIGGSSAGGGLGAGLVLLAHDRGEVPIAFQLLIYPMLDDRTALRTDIDERWLRMWTTRSNRFGWTSYLGREPGGDDVPDYAAPARRADLSGLPAAWLGVGTCDLFHDEGVGYAGSLGAGGVACELNVVEGAFHGFDMVAGAQVVRDFRSSYVAALKQGLGIA